MTVPRGPILKNPPVNARDTRDMSSTLEKEMAAHSSILAWKIQWTEEHGGLQFMVQLSNWAAYWGKDWRRTMGQQKYMIGKKSLSKRITGMMKIQGLGKRDSYVGWRRGWSNSGVRFSQGYQTETWIRWLTTQQSCCTDPGLWWRKV